MKTHYCKADKAVISYEGECNWCGEKENGVKEEALKLADKLDGLNSCEPVIIKACEDMIRRLVEELDEKNYRILELTKRYKALTWNDKQVEPFAWSCWNDDMPSAIITFTEPDKYDWMSIKPLYTTPQTKPLSDEEIWELHQEHIDEISCGHSMKTIGFVEFARAIEERHGIK